MINTIIFDLGGVLVDWNPDYVYQKLIPDEQRRQYFYEHVCPGWWNENQDAGYPLAQAMADRVALYPDWANEINAYYGRWTEMLGEAIHENVAVLKKALANPNYQVLALTNWSHETMPWARALDRFSFLNDFHGMVVSGDEKTRKPFHDFYHILLDRYEVSPQHAVFIDDNHHNILAANELNINTVHYHRQLNLEKELENFGVLL